MSSPKPTTAEEYAAAVPAAAHAVSDLTLDSSSSPSSSSSSSDGNRHTHGGELDSEREREGEDRFIVATGAAKAKSSGVAPASAPTAPADAPLTLAAASIGGTAPNPEESAPWWSFIALSWLNPFMKKASRAPIQFEDLFKLRTLFHAATVRRRVEEYMNRVDYNSLGEDEESRRKAFGQRLFLSSFYAFPRLSTISIILHGFSSAGNIASPVIMAFFLSFLNNPSPTYLGYVYCIALFLAQLCVALGWNLSQYIQRNIAMSIKTAFISLTYNKAIRMSPKARQEYSNGRIMNLVASDCSNLESFFTYMNDICYIPVEVTALSILIVVYMKAAGAIGLAFMFIVVGLNAAFTTSAVKFERRALSATDNRVKLTSEVLSGIKIVKFFGWEEALQRQINDLREKELIPQFVLRIISATFSAMITLIPVFTNVIIFGCYYAFGNPMDPATIFTAISIVNLLRLPIAIAPLVASMYWSARVSIQRLAAFLTVGDVDSLPSIHPASEGDDSALVINNASFLWPDAPPASEGEKGAENTDDSDEMKLSQVGDKKSVADPSQIPKLGKDIKNSGSPGESEDSTIEAASAHASEEKQPQLRNIDLKVKKGSLTVIVGKVGAGKSSIMHGVIGDMKRLTGTVDIYGTIAFSTQSAWLQNATVKDNILFGRPYDHRLYESVIYACSLTTDLKLLANGDMTQIGEKGVTLSGGQAARVNLARAVYSNADVLLLDDPLAAVDAHVGRSILENCILGLCKDKTVVLVTHQLHITRHADTVVFVENGEIVEQGTFTQLMKDGKGFASLMAEHGGSAEGKKDGKADEKESKKGDVKEEDENEDDLVATQKLLAEEERLKGGVAFKYYLAYFQMAGGVPLISFLILMCSIWQAEKVLTDLWLTFWVEYKFSGWSDRAYVISLFLLAILQIVLMVIGTFAFAFAGIRASRRMHEVALASVMNAPMSFFETNPIGRIISRFSKDLADTDRQLPRMMQSVLELFFGILGTFGLIAYAVPWVLLLAIPLFPLFLYVLRLFRSTMRELKRVESIARSPLYSQINETLTGLSTVRAYGASDRFKSIQEQLQDIANQPTYIKNTVDSWMSVRAEVTMALIIAAVAIVGYATHVDNSLLGLAVAYSLSLTAFLNIILRNFADLESRMNCVERLHHYATSLPQEAAAFADAARNQAVVPTIDGKPRPPVYAEAPPKKWPSEGAIRFDHLTLRYRPELPPVLQDLSFSVSGGERIGVVGRTGAGKSSLIVAMFRLVEFNKTDDAAGTIWIDGVDISKLGLRELRRSISIIPQTPILFDGTIRSNLDPTDSHTDEALWSVLDRCALKEYISALDAKLNAPVIEGGDNLSVGQRQLLCLGRAMLLRNPILVIDEATASVDMETDQRIQGILREDFRGCTIVCIAHRLNTLVDYDRILVLDKGKILEFDSPRALASQPTSAFSSLVDETGPANAAVLRSLIMSSS
ncbi:P-loop containing nucleoside triphosphate hydrolase protein [Zopfochytrium polystomum]|nr:P-loop containing nucleoside triphosphate hydrolase protein [Zopfochytrium polystomum]